MARKLRLSEENAARFRPGRAEYTIWDSGIAGLGVRVRPSGSRTFVFHCNAHGRSKRFTLGRVGVKPIDEARRECLEIRLREAGGGSADRHGSKTLVPSFRDFVLGDWTEACRGRHKPLTKKSIDSHLRTQLLPAFGSLPLDRISRCGRHRLVRHLQPHIAGRRQPRARHPVADHEPRARLRSCCEQSRPWREEEPRTAYDPFPVAGRDPPPP